MGITKMGGGQTREESILRHILGVESIGYQFSELSRQETAEKQKLSGLLTSEQRLDFHRVIRRLQLDVHIILSLSSPEAFKEYYIKNACEVERLQGICPCVEQDLIGEGVYC